MATVRSDTKDHILDVAERHFALYGFAGTSLRGIISEAEVNVAAVAYHFGAKEELFAAVMERFAVPVVDRQLERLRKVLAKSDVTLTDAIQSFYEPPITLIKKMGERGASLSMFLGRAHTEPEPAFSLVDRHYAACRNEFIAAFRKLLPRLSDADLHWCFEFMLSLIVCFLTRQKQIRGRYSESADWKPDAVVLRLVSFCEAGFVRCAESKRKKTKQSRNS
jgi:AcrR family transcriptional regulator